MPKEKKFYHSREFAALQRKWYAKLKQEGFEDIEWVKGGAESCYPRTAARPRSVREFTADYYDAATAEALARCLQRQSWKECLRIAMHAAGYSVRETAQILGYGHRKFVCERSFKRFRKEIMERARYGY